MATRELQQIGTQIASISDRLREIAEGLHDRSVEELGTGRPVNSNVAEAISAIEAVCTDLQKLNENHSIVPIDTANSK
ncbi:MAG: hypothetical protein ABI645_11845 [Pseudomonadota bacterium]